VPVPGLVTVCVFSSSKHSSPSIIIMSTVWMNIFYIAILILDLIGLVSNVLTMVYLQTTFNIKKHVFLLIYIDASISAICAAVSSINDVFLMSGYVNYPSCYIITMATYLPCSCGALLTLLIAAIRYDLAKKSAKNIVPTNKKILCFPLTTFVAFTLVLLMYTLFCASEDIPFSYFFDVCISPEREPRKQSALNTIILLSPNLFNFISVYVDVSMIRDQCYKTFYG
jgi:hypothetical protein